LSDKANAELKQILEEFIPSAGLQMRGWAGFFNQQPCGRRCLIFKFTKISHNINTF
jgi:hypothetical protein